MWKQRFQKADGEGRYPSAGVAMFAGRPVAGWVSGSDGQRGGVSCRVSANAFEGGGGRNADFSQLDELRHFPGRDIVVAELGVRGGKSRELFMECDHLGAEQGIDIAGLASVSVQLDESPVGASLNMNMRLHPEFEAVPGGGASMVQVSVFNARE